MKGKNPTGNHSQDQVFLWREAGLWLVQSGVDVKSNLLFPREHLLETAGCSNLPAGPWTKKKSSWQCSIFEIFQLEVVIKWLNKFDISSPIALVAPWRPQTTMRTIDSSVAVQLRVNNHHSKHMNMNTEWMINKTGTQGNQSGTEGPIW